MRTSLKKLLNEYFENDAPASRPFSVPKTSNPVQVRKFSWEVHTDPERFSKSFKFGSRERLASFVSEVMRHEDHINHHGQMRIDHLDVNIEIYTKDINRITELDKEYAVHIDRIYRDVLDFDYR